jgi:hypothetical protein
MKSLKYTTAAFVVGALLMNSTAAQAATRIKFAKGSYCGSYAGNYKNGRTFTIRLLAEQRFTVRNSGTGRQTTWSVSGPSGDLEPTQTNASTLEYYTEDDGDHYVYVTSTSTRSSIEFCAYS